jgi:hypothetical protein
MSAVPSKGAEGVGSLYSIYKSSMKVNIAGVSKVMSTPTDLATYVVQNFYDGDTGQGQRADLIGAIATAIGLYKGNI